MRVRRTTNCGTSPHSLFFVWSRFRMLNRCPPSPSWWLTMRFHMKFVIFILFSLFLMLLVVNVHYPLFRSRPLRAIYRSSSSDDECPRYCARISSRRRGPFSRKLVLLSAQNPKFFPTAVQSASLGNDNLKECGAAMDVDCFHEKNSRTGTKNCKYLAALDLDQRHAH